MSMRIVTSMLSEETRTNIIKYLHYTKPNTHEEIFNNKRYGTPLPDYSVDCFIYDKEKQTIDIPFYKGKEFYTPISKAFGTNNINSLMKKSTFNVEFFGVPKPEQVSMIEEAILCLQKNDCVLLQGRPGFGKTFVATLCACTFGLSTLIVVNRTILLKQWKDTIHKFSKGVAWVVGEKMPLNPDGTPKKVDFVISMIDALNKIDSEYLLKFGTLCLDEAHMLMTPKQVPAILKIRPTKLILCTATPDRDIRTTNIIKAFIGDNRIVRRYDGFLKVIKYYTRISVDVKSKKIGRRERMDWSDFQEKLQEHEGRNQKILQWVLQNLKSKIMILGWRKKHSEIICSLLQKANINADYYSGTKKTYIDGNVLVGTFSKIGAGFDPSSNENWDNLHYDLLLMIGTTRSLANTEQYIGRVFRSKKPHVVIFVDDHNTCESQYTDMMKVINLYKPEIVESNNVIEI